MEEGLVIKVLNRHETATDVCAVSPAASSRTIFRIEKPEDRNGMWYNKNGVFMKTIDILCPNGIAKDFPMPLNLELHRKDGEIWNSAGKSIENMNEWFTPMDAINLMNNGYKLFQFEVNMFQELENEILFLPKRDYSTKGNSVRKCLGYTVCIKWQVNSSHSQ